MIKKTRTKNICSKITFSKIIFSKLFFGDFFFEKFQNSIGISMIPFITCYKGNHRNPYRMKSEKIFFEKVFSISRKSFWFFFDDFFLAPKLYQTAVPEQVFPLISRRGVYDCRVPVKKGRSLVDSVLEVERRLLYISEVNRGWLSPMHFLLMGSQNSINIRQLKSSVQA